MTNDLVQTTHASARGRKGARRNYLVEKTHGALVDELISTDDTRERPSFDVIGTREGVAAVSFDRIEIRAAL